MTLTEAREFRNNICKTANSLYGASVVIIYANPLGTDLFGRYYIVESKHIANTTADSEYEFYKNLDIECWIYINGELTHSYAKPDGYVFREMQ